MGKRGENIRKRKDGRWEARMICRHGRSGEAKCRSFYGKTYLEAKRKRNNFIRESGKEESMVKKSEQNKQQITVACLMEEWLDWKRDEIKESTLAHYKNILKKHILPKLGKLQLHDLDSETIDTFLKEKLLSGRLDGKGGLSPKTVTDIRSVLILGFKYAEQRHYPCVQGRTFFYPKIGRLAVKVLTREEQTKLEQILYQELSPINIGVLIALYGGLRIGELCALRWADFDGQNGTLKIDKTLLRIQNTVREIPEKTKILIGEPKTESSNRLIPLSSFLTQYQKEDGDYILTGTPDYLEPRICLEKYKKILHRAGLSSFTFHSLRHTFATRCVESGFDIKSLSEILGHANVNTTLQRYVHPTMERKKQQMDRLEKISIWGQNKGRRHS